MKGRTGKTSAKLMPKPHGQLHIDTAGEKNIEKKHGGKVGGKKPHERADKRARGGGIHIKPSHKGLLTKEVGKKGLKVGNLRKEIAHDKKEGNVAKEKREVFALNAKTKFKH